MTMHTPGPWQECQKGKCTCGQVWSIPGDFPVCTVRIPKTPVAVAHENMADTPDMIYQSITPEMCYANARLIAAAPDMYEAALPIVALVQDFSGPDDAMISVTAGEIRRLAAALSKAVSRS